MNLIARYLRDSRVWLGCVLLIEKPTNVLGNRAEPQTRAGRYGGALVESQSTVRLHEAHGPSIRMGLPFRPIATTPLPYWYWTY